MLSTRTILIISGIIGLIVAAVLLWFQLTLNRSRATAESIPSRAVVADETVASQREAEPEASTPEYLKELSVAQAGQTQVTQAQDAMNSPELLASGTFNRLDTIHRAQGMIEIVGDDENVFLQFPDNFDVASGPDLYVVLTLGESYDEATSLNLGPLLSTEGAQTYQITRAEREQYQNGSVLIWCRAFDVDFSVAKFE